MKFLTFKTILFSFILISIYSKKIYSQGKLTTVQQDPKFEQLLNEKRKINSSITVNDRYKIQIYNGVCDVAKKTLLEFKKEFKKFDGTIVFSTPVYKVWIGNFKTRIEAEKNLLDIKKKYPNAFLIRPNK